MIAAYFSGVCVVCVLALDRAETVYLTSGQWGERAGRWATHLRLLVQVVAWLTIVAWVVEGRLSH